MEKNNNIFRFLPNFITSLNLLSGSLSIILSFEGFPLWSAYLIFLAAVFDFLDGLTARVLKAYSDMGKELDSLADLISFGMAPAAIAFNLMKTGLFLGVNDISDLSFELTFMQVFFLASVLLIPVFSGLRLAKFNVDTRQTDSFIGLPTPANAIFWASLPVITLKHPGFFNNIIGKIDNVPIFLSFSAVFLSILLVSELPMFSLKFKNLKIEGNVVRFSFLAIAFILLLLLQIKSVPIIIVVYIIISVILYIVKILKINK
jgi:CDP-diacylglycerol--serine O-phosphatidyltransferase